ncbi:MAG: PEGA domain-containing protein [Chitinispirillaceae bacterium]|nr:PEGA domain-containing protein [Chitinispirillaceae bacterium]
MYLKIMLLYIFLPALFLFFNASFAGEILSGEARFHFPNAPDSVVVKVDGNSIDMDSTGWYTVTKGLKKIELLLSDTLLFSLSRYFSENEEKKIHLNCNDDCGGVEINSVPDGARLSIDDEYTTTTPATNHFLTPGKHTLKLGMPGLETVYKDFEIAAQNISKMTFTLIRNKNSKNQAKIRGRKITTAIFCVMTASLASASAWYEYSAHTYLSNARDASDLYDAACENFGIYKANYYHARKKAKNAIEIRNALTIATGVGLTGCLITIFF